MLRSVVGCKKRPMGRAAAEPKGSFQAHLGMAVSAMSRWSAPNGWCLQTMSGLSTPAVESAACDPKLSAMVLDCAADSRH